MIRNLIANFVAGLIAVGGCGLAHAAETQVAVAANFAEPAKAIAAAFQLASGHTATINVGATGAFYSQITHGAPFEVLLAADAATPERLEKEGLAAPGTRFTYAVGRLVLYSTTPGLVDQNGYILRRGAFNKLAIADPVLAPYGLAAMQVMTKLGLAEALAPKLVKGTSLTQAYQFTSTGAADLGFVAYSQVITVAAGSRWLVPARLHAPITQQAVLLKTGTRNPAATAFIKYLHSRQAVAIIRSYGYLAH